MLRSSARRVTVVLISCGLIGLASPALAQRYPARVWIAIDDSFASPTQDAQSFTSTQPLFQEVASATVEYPSVTHARIPAFGGGLRIYRGLGVGFRRSAEEQQTLQTGISVRVPDPVFFNRPRTAHVDAPLDRSERLTDWSIDYQIPLPERIAIRAFAGRSRVQITQDVIGRVTYFDGAGAVQPITMTKLTGDAFAWGSLVGVDAAFFPIRNVGVGLMFAQRNVDIPTQPEPFSGGSLTLSAHRSRLAVGLRLRF